ncbi:RRM domain-containing protein [Mycena indigotica]|uniref:RRM domain-containing protein n=1 Tax=Mycena indigotica TaxID=2126181 RepID=A0A8H6S8Y4_9AGAR|nr:RRM domain-containing protein [Mycena indigotica]KAF7293470.1 RRM domain-containing protein [Mycena indigotica]
MFLRFTNLLADLGLSVASLFQHQPELAKLPIHVGQRPDSLNQYNTTTSPSPSPSRPAGVSIAFSKPPTAHLSGPVFKFSRERNAARVENIPDSANRLEILALFRTFIGDIRSSQDLDDALEITFFHWRECAKSFVHVWAQYCRVDAV